MLNGVRYRSVAMSNRRNVGCGMRKRGEIDKKRLAQGLAVCALSVGIVQAAVPNPEPSSPLQRATAQEKGDDWFAEIDDMIEELVVPAPLAEATNPPAAQSGKITGQTTEESSPLKQLEETGYAVERPLVRKQLAQLAPTPVPAPETVQEQPAVPPTNANATAQAIDSSIIEEILRSDYWLEDSSSQKTNTSPSNVTDGRKIVTAPTNESAVAELTLPTVTAEDQLLLLEKELLRDIAKPAQPIETPAEPAVAETTAAEQPAEQSAQASAEPVEAAAPSEPEEAAPAMTQLEEELLAELNDFGAEQQPAEDVAATAEPTAEPQIAATAPEEDVQTGQLLDQIAKETKPAEQAPEAVAVQEPVIEEEVDAVLTQVEQRAAAQPEELDRDDLFIRVESVQARMDDAIRRGDRAELAALSTELNKLLQETGQSAQLIEEEPARVMASAEVTPEPVSADAAPKAVPVETTPARRHEPKQMMAASTPEQIQKEPASPLAASDRHTKRFSRDVGEEQREQVASTEIVDSSKAAGQKVRPPAVERTIIVMNADQPTTPLKRKEGETKPVFAEQKTVVMAPETAPVKQEPIEQAALPEKSAPLKAPRLRQTTEVAAAKPAASGRPDPLVFMRTAPSDEARPPAGTPMPAKAKNTAVVIPPAAPATDDWDAPVPFD